MPKHVLYKGHNYDLEEPIDVSIAFRSTNGVNCYFAPTFETEPVVLGDFVGDINRGSPVNYKNIRLNAHGNGTHTECVAHISNIQVSMADIEIQPFLSAQLITAETTYLHGDWIVQDPKVLPFVEDDIEALLIRTLPNSKDKLARNYSGTNPPYLSPSILTALSDKGIQHILVDLPSLDREEDGGKLLAHRAFWNFPDTPRLNATITELIYVDPSVSDGRYLLNLQVARLESDASPSRPILFPLSG